MSKKAIPIILTVIICGFAAGVIIFHDFNIPLFPSEKYEDYEDNGVQDHTDFCRYKYKRDIKLNGRFYEVTEFDISYIKSILESFPYDFLDEPENYDFSAKKVTIGDKYYIRESDPDTSGGDSYSWDDATVYYYDAESKMLYYFHNDN